ncbi:MAG TPA: hypothetical protein ENG66_04590 [Thermococcus sp.]|nr:hypothetical protein [Thermococcus sp.]
MQILWLLAIVISMGAALWSLRLGAMLYLVGALIFPALWINETTAVRFELIYALWLFSLLYFHKVASKSMIRWHPILTKYTVFLGVIFLSTMLALIDAPSISLSGIIIPFYGMLRPLLVMFLFLNVAWEDEFIFRLFQMFFWLAIPIALLSIGQTLGINLVEQITMQGYTSPSRTPVFRLLEEQGVILRSTGVFESPVYNGVYWILVLTTTGFALFSGLPVFRRRSFLYLILGLALLAGITTLSSTFLAGAVLGAAALVFLLGYRYPRRFFRFAIGSTLVAGMLVFLILPHFMQNSTFTGTFSYQINRTLSATMFYTRYDPKGGIFAETYEAIGRRPIIGWGLTEVEGAFVGDSIYVSMLYRGGVIGLGIFLWVIYSILKHAWRHRKMGGLQGRLAWVVLLWTLLLLATGVGSPSFFILRLQEWYWALVGISLGLSSQAYRNKI